MLVHALYQLKNRTVFKEVVCLADALTLLRFERRVKTNSSIAAMVSDYNKLDILKNFYPKARFCRLCGTLKSKEDDLRKYIINEGTSECNTNKRQQMLTFKLCTPSKEQWREDNGDHEEKLQEYWNYLKQGVLTAVIHVMDRSEPSEKRLQQCAQLCSTFSSQKALSSSYRSTLLHSIEKMCAPNDTYTACIYHTMKFDVNEDSR
uniref:Dimer_Tnp_hAT domain-containing protein n=1 Tax=Ascaris lumbricoides TaxID=6252 RepID=A0A0M3IT48_ASCLU